MLTEKDKDYEKGYNQGINDIIKLLLEEKVISSDGEIYKRLIKMVLDI